MKNVIDGRKNAELPKNFKITCWSILLLSLVYFSAFFAVRVGWWWQDLNLLVDGWALTFRILNGTLIFVNLGMVLTLFNIGSSDLEGTILRKK